MATQKPDLTRVWAEGAPPANVVDPDTTTPGKVSAGWQAEVPPFEHFNFLQKWFTQGLAHFNEEAVGLWDSDTLYPVNGMAKGSNGLIYKALLEQSGNDPISNYASGDAWYIFNDHVNVKDFGAVGDGVTDDYDAIQAAINTRKSVFIPGGEYYISQTLAPHKQQEIRGEGGVQRASLDNRSSTRLLFDSGTDGFDTSVNIALGCKIKYLAVVANDQVTGNGSIGIKLGVKGTSGGISQNLKIELVDLLVRGFDINYGIYGWSWEVTLHRCLSDFPRSVGFETADSPTIVTMTDCSDLLGGSAYGSSPANLSARAYNFESGQIYLHSPRAENTQGTGFYLSAKSKVTIDSIYCEGNRVQDVVLSSDFSGQLIITGGRMIHDNTGVDTFACVRNGSSEKCFVHISGIQYALGLTTNNSTTSGFYYAESTIPHVIIEGLIVEEDVAKMSSGNREVVYLSQSGRYAPSEFTVTDLPDVRFYRRGTSHIAKVEGSLPTSLLISDGSSTYDMLREGSIGLVDGRTYRWVAAKSAWALISLREYANLDRQNSASTPNRWWGDYKGIEIVRFSGNPASATITIDTTGASKGADFYVRSYSTQTTPATITVEDELGATIATLTPSFTGAGGVVAKFSYFNLTGIGTNFQLQHILREN